MVAKDETKFDFNNNWYDLWMKQSKEFFETAEKNLKGIFDQKNFANPEEHLTEIRHWLDMMKSQWQFVQLNEQQKAFEKYWQTMSKMCTDAYDLMIEKWVARTRANNPVKDVHELYELWLNCCQEVYQKSMHSQTYQDAYGEYMNAALKYWKSVMPK